ncbi:MAG: transporter substrate-binding domain-containing protein [Clostridia bacterium]|nr:transporter substrate-binding domain-containing protein [Clostridia bacterium]
MKKLLTLLVALLMSVTCIFGLTACNEGNKDTIVVYTEAGFAPFEYVEGNKIVGVDVDIMNLVGQKLGKTVKFESVSFDTICDQVSSGKLCDVGAAGLSITEARKQQVAFSNEYYTANLYVIYKTNESATYESTTTDNVTGVYWNSLRDKVIAVQNGTTADLFLGDELAEGGSLYGSSAAKTGFSSLSYALEDLNSNSDVLIIDELPAKMLIEGEDGFECAPLYWQGENGEDDEPSKDVYAIAVCPTQDARLLYAINEVIAELGEEGIQNLVNKHLGLTDGE